MAKFRQVYSTFWEDPDAEDWQPLEKFFYLYLITNPQTRACGIYEITLRRISYETGLGSGEVKEMLQKFQDDYKKIVRNQETNEIVIKNWLKYNSINSPKVKTCVLKELATVKDKNLIGYLYGIDRVFPNLNNEINGMPTVLIGYSETQRNKDNIKIIDKDNINNNNNNISPAAIIEEEEEHFIKELQEEVLKQTQDPIQFQKVVNKTDDIAQYLEGLKAIKNNIKKPGA